MTKYDEIITLVSNKYNLDKDLVKKIYSTYWKTIKTIMLELPLKSDMTEEEFNKLRPNINIQRLGKLYVLYPKYLTLRKKYEKLQKKDD